jgi:hypothetical protein
VAHVDVADLTVAVLGVADVDVAVLDGRSDVADL